MSILTSQEFTRRMLAAQEAVRKKKMGLLARSATVRRIVEKMREIIELFSWE